MHYSFGLGESSLDHRRREEFPAIFTIMVSFGELMKELTLCNILLRKGAMLNHENINYQ